MKGGEHQDTEVKVFFFFFNLTRREKKKKSRKPNKMFYICLYIHSLLPP